MVERMMQCLSAIKTRKVNCSILARELEWDRKTINRDIQFMRDRLGYNIQFDERNNHYFIP